MRRVDPIVQSVECARQPLRLGLDLGIDLLLGVLRAGIVALRFQRL